MESEFLSLIVWWSWIKILYQSIIKHNLPTVYLIVKSTKMKTAKKRRTMQFKGQAGSAVFRSTSLLANSQVNRNWLLQIPLAPDCGR
jgi:hypothetical protein